MKKLGVNDYSSVHLTLFTRNRASIILKFPVCCLFCYRIGLLVFDRSSKNLTDVCLQSQGQLFVLE